MQTTRPSVRLILVLLVVPGLFLTACSGGGEGEDEGPLRLTFDGESCTYEGPKEVSAGSVTLDFVNESEEHFNVNLVILDEGKTVQDVIDDLGPEPSTRHHPSWTHEMGTWDPAVMPGETVSWEGDLEAGIYAMVCAAALPSTDPKVFRGPLGVWFGTGLTVEG